MKNWLIASALFGLLSCSRDPTLLVTVDALPSKAMSLQVEVTHGGFAAVKDLDPYDLPSPTPGSTTFLLRLPGGFSGDVGVSVGAFDQAGGLGCLVGTGHTSSAVAAPQASASIRPRPAAAMRSLRAACTALAANQPPVTSSRVLMRPARRSSVSWEASKSSTLRARAKA